MFDYVFDRELAEIRTSEYDLAVFSSGYESRCTHVPSLLKREQVHKVMVLGFNENCTNEVRLECDSFFRSDWADPLILERQSCRELFDGLASCFVPGQACRILIDYSSMSRSWYNGILGWCLSSAGQVDIDCTYSFGVLPPSRPPRALESLVTLPGCGGRSESHDRSALFLGLSLDPVCCECVFEILEPDILHVFHGVGDKLWGEYTSGVQELNRELLSEASAVFGLPTSSVQRSYAILMERIAKLRDSWSITLAPVGPKPLILASMLAAIRDSQASCLRVGFEHLDPVDIPATGETTCVRVAKEGKGIDCQLAGG